MVFEEIILSPNVIQNLYANTLIDVVSTSKKNQEQIIDRIEYLGDNKKNITLIIKDNEAKKISDFKLNFIIKILSACQLTLADVAIVNASNNNYLYGDIIKTLNPRNLILFGVDGRAFELPLIFPEYRIQQYNQCNMLIVFDLEKYLIDDEKTQTEKRKLWGCLKQLFSN